MAVTLALASAWPLALTLAVPLTIAEAIAPLDQWEIAADNKPSLYLKFQN